MKSRSMSVRRSSRFNIRQTKNTPKGTIIMLNLDTLKFDQNGLIPAIVVDAISGKVLTLAYMNRESLAISMEKGLTCFWSRSRQEL